MRIVFLSDTHGAKLEHTVPDGDILIHCGDFSKMGKEQELSSFSDWFFSFPHKEKIFIAGNHDLLFEKEPARARSLVAKGHYLVDEAVVINGVKIYGSPWTPEYYSWAFMRPRGEDMRQIWQKIPPNTDVLLTHGPAMGCLDYVPPSDTHAGCEELAKVVEVLRPAVHAFGHIHEGYGTSIREWEDSRQTISINASICNLRYAGVNPPVVVDLERDSRTNTLKSTLVS